MKLILYVGYRLGYLSYNPLLEYGREEIPNECIYQPTTFPIFCPSFRSDYNPCTKATTTYSKHIYRHNLFV